MKKNSGVSNWVGNQGFYHFLKVASLVFLDIAQDCSLGQCLASVDLKPPKNICCPNWGQNDLFCSNVMECPLKLACFKLISYLKPMKICLSKLMGVIYFKLITF